MKNKNRKYILVTGLLIIFTFTACAPAAESEATVVVATETPEENPQANTVDLGDCYNPFYPVIEGRTWTYRIQTSDSTDEYSITYSDVSQSSFTSNLTFPDVTSSIQWSCSPEGLLSSDFANLNFLQIENIKVETNDVTGVNFPKAENWRVGYSWDLNFNVNITFAFEGNSFESQGEIAMNNNIVAIEPVSVPAGDYNEAYRVDTSGTLKFSAMGAETEMPITSSNWYVENVGLVKSISADTETGYTTELILFE